MSSSRTFGLVALGLFASAPLLLAACAKEVSFGGPPPCQPGTPCAQDAGGSSTVVNLVPPSASTPAASASAPASASASASASAGPVPRTTPDVIDQGIEVAIRQHALKVGQKGAMPDSQVLRVDLAEGEHSSIVYTLQPNTCYTFIAAGVPGVVKELEVKLLLAPFFTLEAGKGKGQPAVLGKTPAAICPISPVPLPYKVDVAATKGAGRVGLMIFAKPK